jgi:hypothetical protein
MNQRVLDLPVKIFVDGADLQGIPSPDQRARCNHERQETRCVERLWSTLNSVSDLPGKAICATHDNTRATVWFSPDRKA